MTAITVTYNQVSALRPCADSFSTATRLVGDVKKWKTTALSFADLHQAGVPFGDLIWLASAMAPGNKDIERRLRLWICDVAAHVHHHFAKAMPNDDRPRKAIEAGRKFARGEISAAALATALAAARAAARAAALAAAWDAARAAAGDAEEKWQLACLLARMSDIEPDDEPIAGTTS